MPPRVSVEEKADAEFATFFQLNLHFDDNSVDPRTLPPLCDNEELTRILAQRAPISDGGAGLTNEGNDCFALAVIQALASLPPLATYLMARSCDKGAFKPAFDCLAATLRALRSTNARTDAVAPIEILHVMRRISGKFEPTRQHDATEFLVKLLDYVRHQDVIARAAAAGRDVMPLRAAFTAPLSRMLFSCIRQRIEWSAQAELAARTSRGLPIAQELRDQAAAGRDCDSSTFDFYGTFELVIPVGMATLKTCLERHFFSNRLDGTEMYTPDKDVRVRAEKTHRFHVLAPVLLISLKRFDNAGKKDNRYVKFLSELDIAPYCTEECKRDFSGSMMYRLCAVVVHLGETLRKGHYICFRLVAPNKWRKFSDDAVTDVSDVEVLNEQAYMLFYCSASVLDAQATVVELPRFEFDQRFAPSLPLALVAERRRRRAGGASFDTAVVAQPEESRRIVHAAGAPSAVLAPHRVAQPTPAAASVARVVSLPMQLPVDQLLVPTLVAKCPPRLRFSRRSNQDLRRVELQRLREAGAAAVVATFATSCFATRSMCDRYAEATQNTRAALFYLAGLETMYESNAEIVAMLPDVSRACALDAELFAVCVAALEAEKRRLSVAERSPLLNKLGTAERRCVVWTIMSFFFEFEQLSHHLQHFSAVHERPPVENRDIFLRMLLAFVQIASQCVSTADIEANDALRDPASEHAEGSFVAAQPSRHWPLLRVHVFCSLVASFVAEIDLDRGRFALRAVVNGFLREKLPATIEQLRVAPEASAATVAEARATAAARAVAAVDFARHHRDVLHDNEHSAVLVHALVAAGANAAAATGDVTKLLEAAVRTGVRSFLDGAAVPRDPLAAKFALFMLLRASESFNRRSARRLHVGSFVLPSVEDATECACHLFDLHLTVGSSAAATITNKAILSVAETTSVADGSAIQSAVAPLTSRFVGRQVIFSDRRTVQTPPQRLVISVCILAGFLSQSSDARLALSQRLQRELHPAVPYHAVPEASRDAVASFATLVECVLAYVNPTVKEPLEQSVVRAKACLRRALRGEVIDVRASSGDVERRRWADVVHFFVGRTRMYLVVRRRVAVNFSADSALSDAIKDVVALCQGDDAEWKDKVVVAAARASVSHNESQRFDATLLQSFWEHFSWCPLTLQRTSSRDSTAQALACCAAIALGVAMSPHVTLPDDVQPEVAAFRESWERASERLRADEYVGVLTDVPANYDDSD